MLAIVSEHRFEKYTQILMSQAVKIPIKHLQLFNSHILPSVMQQVLARKGKYVLGVCKQHGGKIMGSLIVRQPLNIW